MKPVYINKKQFLSRSLMIIAGLVVFILLIKMLSNQGLLLNISQTNPPYSSPSPVEKKAPDQLQTADLILLGAKQEVANATRYDASYQVIAYPNGDVASDVGACTDVIIRAFRNAGIDIQELIHEDMQTNFELYPQNWGLDATDSNIDHRRVPNQICFFKRHGKSLTTEVKTELSEWQWGDLVYWQFITGDEHCGIISDRTTRDGIPLVIHNAGLAKEEDVLQRWKITGHYRYDYED